MGRKRKRRRQPHGAAWHWRQTDCWYCTVPGTKERVPLFHETGKRIRGKGKDPVKGRYSCYTCRHTFAHRMLSGFWNGGAGCSIEVLAVLIGDTPKVAFDHYGREWSQHHVDPLWTAIGVGESD